MAYGEGVPIEATVAARLGASVRASQGWSPFNERAYLAASGLRPAVVVLVVCLNDVVNPRLHWGYTPGRFAIPDAAIPDLEDDRLRVQPIVRDLWGVGELARLGMGPKLRSWAWAQRRIRGTPALDAHVEALARGTTAEHDGATWPTLVTAEDTLDLRVLEGPSTPQWAWLTDQLRQFDAEVEAWGGTPIVAFVPLAYQLDRDYPWTPQSTLTEVWCPSEGVLCVDVLPAMRGRDPRDLFLLERSGYFDLWHLTEEGHRVVADVVGHHLPERSTRL